VHLPYSSQTQSFIEALISIQQFNNDVNTLAQIWVWLNLMKLL